MLNFYESKPQTADDDTEYYKKIRERLWGSDEEESYPPLTDDAKRELDKQWAQHQKEQAEERVRAETEARREAQREAERDIARLFSGGSSFGGGEMASMSFFQDDSYDCF